MVSESHARRIRASLDQGLLNEGELRRVVGLGAQFIALASTKVGDEYAETLSFSLDRIDYKIYSKVGDPS